MCGQEYGGKRYEIRGHFGLMFVCRSCHAKHQVKQLKGEA